MKSVLALGILAALAAATTSAQSVQITGFGQMVAGSVIDGTRSPTTGERSFPGTGYDSDWDFKDESLFAVQVRGDLNEQWSATAQIVARGREDFDPEFAWAYVGWNGGNGWSAKFGRQRLPLYRYSDFLEVGYAFPWVRVPNAVYNLPFDNFDGLGVGYGFAAGDWYTNVQLSAGRYEDEIVAQGARVDSELTGLWGVAADTTYADWLTLRAGYYKADVSIDLTPLDGLFTALNSNGFRNVTEALDYTEDSGSFWSVGGEVNRGSLLLVGELIGVDNDDTLLADRSEFYLTGGWRFGSVMPHVTYGRRDNDPKLGAIALLPNVAPLAPLRAGVAQAVRSEDIDATYWSYGLRWDVANNVALKADYTRYTNDTPAVADADAVAVGVVFTF